MSSYESHEFAPAIDELSLVSCQRDVQVQLDFPMLMASLRAHVQHVTDHLSKTCTEELRHMTKLVDEQCPKGWDDNADNLLAEENKATLAGLLGNPHFKSLSSIAA